MTKILIGGFQHETNTFSPVLTEFNHFAIASEWPGLARGDEIFEKLGDPCNIPVSGFINAAKKNNIQCVPGTWCAASPSGKVTNDTFEKIAAMILEDVTQYHEQVDAIVLDLHGAMVAEHYDDGEGELLQRIRAITGPDLPIVIALDFHANLSDKMLELCNEMHIYKTYPHMDMYETGERCISAALRLLSNNKRTYKALRHTRYMMPLNAQCTLISPFKDIYTKIAELEAQTNTIISLAPGFALSDIKNAGPAVAIYAESPSVADDVANQVITLLDSYQKDFHVKLYKPLEAIAYAKQHPQDKPIVFADTQDNSGAGGTSDTMGIFRALVDTQTKNAIVVMIVDDQAAGKAFKTGAGNTVELTLGEKSAGNRGSPFTAEFLIKNVSDKIFDATPGSYYEGCHIDIGPTAYVECEGVAAIIGSRKMQAADRALLTHLGADPNSFDILVLKSSVHFRADFMRLSDTILTVQSPGEAIANLSRLTYEKCNKDVDLSA